MLEFIGVAVALADAGEGDEVDAASCTLPSTTATGDAVESTVAVEDTEDASTAVGIASGEESSLATAALEAEGGMGDAGGVISRLLLLFLDAVASAAAVTAWGKGRQLALP